MKIRIFILFFAMLFTAAVVSAAPSINGSTGTIENPSADVLRPGQFALGYYHLKDGTVGVFDTNLAKNLEIGVVNCSTDLRRGTTHVNAKFALAPEGILTPGLSVGVEDIGGDYRRSLYIVASKVLPYGLRFHAGIGNGQFNGPFFSLEKTINPASVIVGNNTFPVTTLLVEYTGRNMNYGARIAVVPGLKLDAGWRQHAFYVGMSFTN